MEQLKELVGRINENIFLSEFTFIANAFQDIKGYEKEFADCVTILDDSILIFQVKERAKSAVENYESEEKWFENKVLKKAKEQIKSSVGFFKTNPSINIANIRGHAIDIRNLSIAKIINLIIFKHDIVEAPGLKHYKSEEVGFIHILDYYDYFMLCDLLATPQELIEYFDYRKDLIERYNIGFTSEKNILGAYLLKADFLKMTSNNKSDLIVLNFEGEVDKLRNNRSEYDIGFILKNFEKRIYTERKAKTSYYKILMVLSRMTRVERRSFRERWLICCKKAISGSDDIDKPYRMVIPSSELGFVFISIPEDDFETRLNALTNITMLSKYDQKLNKQIGISFCGKDKQMYIDYSYMEGPWVYDENNEKMLNELNIFRPLRHRKISRYTFDDKES